MADTDSQPGSRPDHSGDIYLFAEGVFDWVNNFGRDGFDLSDNTFAAGLMVEF